MKDKLETKGDIPEENDVHHKAGVSRVLCPEAGKREDKASTPENDRGQAPTQTAWGRQEEENRRTVIVAGDLNNAILQGGDKRTDGQESAGWRVPSPDGQGSWEKASDKMWENMQGQNLVVMAGGIDDFLQGREGALECGSSWKRG